VRKLLRSFSGAAARTPLRIKLVATVLALAAVVLTLAAVTATTSLHSYLLDRVDDQLQSASRGITNGFAFRSGGPGPGGFEVHKQRLPSEFYVAPFGPDGAPDGNPEDSPLSAQSPPRLPALTSKEIANLDGRPFTVSSMNGKGQWRVVANPLPDGTGAVVIATSLSDLDHTVNHLILVEVLIGVLALGVMGGGGYLLIKRSLRPLVEVETTAAAIAAGDLSRRVPPGHPRTEVGRLSGALNGMLSQIERAFAQEREAKRRARESEDRMRQFIADASHELRTPLTSIRGFAELHRMGAAQDDDEVKHMMQRVENEASRMGGLVEDLLLLARLDQQRPLDHERVDLLEIASDVVHDVRIVAPERSIDLQVHASQPPVVMGDEARLRQVVHNLMANALTHTPEGTPIAVSVATTDGSEPAAVIEVADAGPGLSPEQADRVFERFYRADTSRSRDAGGAGLGLSIVAGIVAAHDGRVTVETGEGEGTVFRVELPLATDPSGDGSASPPDGAAAVPSDQPAVVVADRPAT